MKRVVCYEAEDGTLTRANEAPGQEPGASLKPLVKLGRQPGDCWQWIGSISKQGYGKKEFNGRTMFAHRWIWERLFGRVPDGKVLTHECANRACVNPHHLRVNTQAAAVRDGVATILTEGDVAEVREMLGDGFTHADIAAKFGVSRMTVSSIASGRAWGKPAKFYGASKFAPTA